MGPHAGGLEVGVALDLAEGRIDGDLAVVGGVVHVGRGKTHHHVQIDLATLAVDEDGALGAGGGGRFAGFIEHGHLGEMGD